MSDPGLPSFSVVVPTHGRPDQLARCLGALAAMDYPADRLEVIVVDDGGDPPARGFEGVCDQLDVTFLRTRHQGPAAARNFGVRHARHEFLAFTDDDCLPGRGWIRALAARMVEAPERAVGGRTVNAPRAGACAEASQFIVDCVNAHYNADPEQARFLISNNLSVSRRVFGAVAGFDPAFRTSEDRDLTDRLLHGEHRIAYASDAVVVHARDLGLVGFWRQQFGYGRGAWLFHRARAGRGAGGLGTEVGFYRDLATLARRRLKRMSGARGATLVALLAVWQVANAAGYAWEGAAGHGRARNRVRAGSGDGRQPPNQPARHRPGSLGWARSSEAAPAARDT